MKLGVHVGYWGLGLSAEDQLALVQEAERLGYDSVWTAEAYGSDAATILGWLAQATSSHPARLGDLPDARALGGDDGDDGRHAGSALRRADDPRHRLVGAAGGRGLARAALRHASSSARASTSRSCGWRCLASGCQYKGETLELPLPDGPGKALKLTIAPVQERIPVFLAAIGPKNTTLAAEIADGWIPTLFSPEHVAEFRPLLEEGFARAGNGKGFDDFEIAPTVNVFVTDDVAAARDAMRPYVALYVGGMGSRDKNFYNALVQRYGFEDAAREVQDLYLEGKRDEAAAALPEELIDTVSLCGPPDVVRERLAVFRDAGVGHADGLADGVDVRRPAAPAPARRRARRLRVLLGAFGDPGHAFPMLALGEALVARGHAVALQTWRRWQEPAEAAGMDVRGGARVPGVPDVGAAAAAVRGGGASGGGDAAGGARRSRRTWRCRTS